LASAIVALELEALA